MPQANKMPVERETLRWSAERRLEFIEYHLFWDGRINRGTSPAPLEFQILKPRLT